ncbi:MAG: hypothetical protein CMG66_01665 [Candidatus Marinimicrobia bacterium]|nr:hypothetical protein [Candidatus Neomarinimicrobiota bacterium]
MFYKFFIKQLCYLVCKSSIMVGGQAIMEGVMMRVPGYYAAAVRDKSGKIHTHRNKFQPLAERYNVQYFPILRGFLHLVDSMKIGFKELEWSANIVEPQDKPNKIQEILLSIFSVMFTISLFMGIPYVITEFGLKSQAYFSHNQFNFNIFAGFLRIIIFLLYLAILSNLKEIKTLFQYHGAEHKVVYNFESGKEINIQRAQEFSTRHPRCGTSFVFILMIVTIFTYSMIDSAFVSIMSIELNMFFRIVLHLCCLPVVSGIGYEVLKFLASKQNYSFFRYLALPGLLLQNITTKEPEDQQVEVSIVALNTAFGKRLTQYQGQTFTADAIG